MEESPGESRRVQDSSVFFGPSGSRQSSEVCLDSWFCCTVNGYFNNSDQSVEGAQESEIHLQSFVENRKCSQFLSIRTLWRRCSVTRPALLHLSSSSSSDLLSRKYRKFQLMTMRPVAQQRLSGISESCGCEAVTQQISVCDPLTASASTRFNILLHHDSTNPAGCRCC